MQLSMFGADVNWMVVNFNYFRPFLGAISVTRECRQIPGVTARGGLLVGPG